MSSHERVEVIVTPEGETKIEAFGFKGNGCTMETAALEKALGSTKKRQFKPEARQVGAQVAAKGRK